MWSYQMENNNISAAELKKRISENDPVVILDVREELEFHTFNIGGENIPLGRLPSLIEELDYEKTTEIVLICQHGIRSLTATALLQAAGFVNARNLQGGLVAYRR